MSELDNAIKKLKENADSKELPYIIADIIKKNCSEEVINLILQNLESIDNSNPSEALECLEKLGTHRIEYWEGFELGFTRTMPFKSTMEYKIIKQALIKAQEQEKVLKIIFKKRVDIELFEICLKKSDKERSAFERYNEMFEDEEERQLTQEEFDLVKRYLNEN